MKKSWKFHYITVVTNLVLILGPTITLYLLGVNKESIDGYTMVTPLSICSILGTAISVGDFALFVKNNELKKFHVNKRYFTFFKISFFVSLSVAIINIIFVLTSVSTNTFQAILKVQEFENVRRVIILILWIIFGVDAILCLTSIGFNRYSTFMIDLEHSKRLKRGSRKEEITKNNNDNSEKDSDSALSGTSGLKDLS